MAAPALPRSLFKEQIQRLTTELGVDYDSKAWNTYVGKHTNWDRSNTIALGNIITDLRRCKDGTSRVVCTPDGLITIQ